MANNIEEITLHVTENSPYVIGARAYVEQTVNGAVITIIDKEGTTTATVSNGVGIASVTLNEDYSLTILYTDGTSTTTTSIRGETGASGVYIGDEEPTDPAVDVWIDTNGDDDNPTLEAAVGAWLSEHPEATTTVLDNSITTAKLYNGAVTTPKLADSAVTEAKILNEAVKTAKIGDGAVTRAKLASAVQTKVDTVDTLVTRVGTAEGDIDTLDARVTNLATLTNGSTTGDAELIDGRVGDDSVTYNNIGTAIRTQFSNVKADLKISEIYADVDKSGAINGFVDRYGVFSTHNDFRLLSPVTLKRGYTIHVKSYGYNTSVAMISVYNADESKYYPLVICTDSNLHDYSYTAPEDMVVGISYYKTEPNIWISYLVETNDDELYSNEVNAQIIKKVSIAIDVSNKYIRSDSGALESSTSFSVSESFVLPKNTTLKFTARGYLTNVAMISVYDSDNDKYYPLIASTVSDIATYEYSATKDTTIVLCFNHHFPCIAEYIYRNKDADGKMDDAISEIYDKAFTNTWEDAGTLVTGKQVQISTAGVVVLANGSDAFKYAVLDVKNVNKVKVYCQAATDVRYSVGFMYATDLGNVIYRYNATSAGAYTVESDVPAGAKTLYVNNNGNNNIIPKIYTPVYVATGNGYSKAEADELFVPKPYTDLSLFSKFGVVGDSYASGELYYSSDYHDKYTISWGQILARKHGVTCTNYSKGGLTTRSWLTDNKGLSLMNASPAEDLYLLTLGINDCYSLGLPYLGSLSDITSHESYEDYGDTFYGNYGRIIEQIQIHAPHAKIVIFTCASTSGNYPAFNNAIAEIAEHYGIPYVVQASDDFFQSAVYTTMSGGHPTAIGYSGMAVAFERLLDKCIRSNISYFFDAFMY